MKLISSVLVLCIFSVVHIECILQGNKINIQNAPYLVSIRDEKAEYIAGGSIISSRLILTSARALDNHNEPKNISVLAGTEVLKGESGTMLTIEKIVKHEDDIALLRTSEEIVFSDKIQPIRIPTFDLYSEKSPLTDGFTVIGWGKERNEDKLNYTSELKASQYPVLDNKNCNLRLKGAHSQFVPSVDDNKICTEQNLPNNGICSGDIGSPLTSGNFLVGIASWYHAAPSNATPAKYTCGNGYPNVYTNVYQYRDWIAKGDGNAIRAASFVLIAFGATLISILYGGVIISEILPLDSSCTFSLNMKSISSVLMLCIFSVFHIECILQGDIINIQSHPYLVSIRNDKNVHIAGGSIISSRLILTSARILDDIDPKSLKVVAGTNHVTIGGITFSVENYAKHEDDIALLRTSEEIVFSDSIQPIRIVTADLNKFEERVFDGVVAGWGKTKNEDKFNYTSELVSKSYLLLDTLNCELRLKEVDSKSVPEIDDTKLCTEQNLPNSGICTGDIGSPLSYGRGGILLGIASWFHVAPSNATSAKYTCGNGYPNVYTNVYSYRDWIENPSWAAKGNGNAIRATSFVLIAFGVTLISIF
ncbi:uncharacterized protein LOC129565821 [Sitodiplosis mosellana]|uniref:uncharacterized protein LOC129565821 n=1 Tax=Sitodiplosis mosellana TaxID=263140 RepID=UPI002443C6B5|nr:uncharacterized protein LOC129565821 [Sitodiplosis mosellana]